jgi:metallo-beta-lactamase family protein
MALAALGVYRRAIAESNPQIRPELRGRSDLFDVGTLVEARDVEASKAIGRERDPAIIVSASGMGTGGRVLHHLKQRLRDARNTVVLTGFQAAGTRGRRLLEGERAVKIFGRYVPVRAEIADLTQFSVHADQSELIDWLKRSPSIPEIVFVVHGEPEASTALRDAIERKLGWCVSVPRYLERVRLDANG